jgi:hypothetical protein
MSDIDSYYKARAKDLTDFLFNEGFLHDDLSRQSIDALEHYLAFILQSHCELAVQAAMLVKKVRALHARWPDHEEDHVQNQAKKTKGENGETP